MNTERRRGVKEKGSKMTYWVYNGKKVVGSVWAEEALSHEAVIALALKTHDMLQLCDIGEAPFERRYALQNAQVKLF